VPRLRVPPCGIFRSVPNCAIVCEVIQGIEKHVEFSARDLLYVAESQLFFWQYEYPGGRILAEALTMVFSCQVVCGSSKG